MKVMVAQNCGFCLGVKNAIKMADETLAKQEEVYSLGEIIHNKDVVKKLAARGLKSAESVEQIPSGTVLIRSHGATDAQLEKIKQKGLKVADATCILVKRVQKIAKTLHSEGYEVIIIGDKGHPEIQAVVGSAPEVSVIGDENDIANLPARKKLGIICQTTQSPEHFAKILEIIAKTDFTELKVINTLCNEARKRQTCAIELCQKVDIMFVLGGLHSANTKKLAELCKSCNKKTFHLQNWKELDKKVLIGNNTAGVTAGASTPQWVIDDFVENLTNFEYK
ncbi:MAG: 4-hydroxy-3-methylbut-2-enyl diphosphate reductase [Anaerohalosphaeraceae bacterium]|nr:4-hydroxy-3-methylbut-2-enyl diphosphate reductase [Anaerohalosphaeraceae bacterium]